ncbi:MAG: transposase [Verrucomicrobiales bacterium]|nr:transposase [Verrucomicrobiales bacterium]MBP9223600.1 transposase [Verrucomicrobiales bacterium]
MEEPGWKNHAKVDLKSKLIIKSVTTSASVHDSQVFKELLNEKGQVVLADSAYHSEEHEAYLLRLTWPTSSAIWTAMPALYAECARSHQNDEKADEPGG